VSSSSSEAGNNHLTEVQIAAYIDRTLTDAQRETVEDHLASCPDCRQQMLETKELIERMKRPRTFLIGGTLAAAAAVAFLILRPGQASIDQRSVMRGGESAPALAAYGPIGDVTRARLLFVWSDAPGAESYRLTLSRVDGSAVWSMSGSDTVAHLPDSVILGENQHYFWVADALLPDGTTRTTGLREFGVVP
jgi:hypothetical protein